MTEQRGEEAESKPAAGQHGAGAPRQVSLRRAPRYRAFVTTGLIIGVLIAAVLILVSPERGEFSNRAVFGYLAVSLALVGGVVGGLIAVLLERPRRR